MYMPRPTAADVSAAMPAHLYTAGLRRYISAYAAVTYSFLRRTLARSAGFPGVNSIRRFARDRHGARGSLADIMLWWVAVITVVLLVLVLLLGGIKAQAHLGEKDFVGQGDAQ